MQQTLNRYLARIRETFGSFTSGQKAIAIIGSVALLIAAFMVFRWVSAPSYSPLYSGLSGADASAVVQELDAQGTSYEITGGGGTIMVPRADVYTTRIALAGKGLPSGSSAGGDSAGYGLLDKTSLSTSDFQEQTTFKRAMEGELAKTIEAIDGVDTVVVQLALPEKKVFADEQDPPTASVLVDMAAGSTMDDGQVQAVVGLVANSVPGLEAKNVKVIDSTGALLSDQGAASGSGAASTRSKQVKEFQDSMRAQIQSVLDRVAGPGNATASVTADLDFDNAVINRRTYDTTANVPPLSESKTSETYSGAAGSGANGAGGIVGPDGQMDSATTASGPSKYGKKGETRDNAVGQTDEHRETAPGGVKSLHIGVILDSTAAATIQPDAIEQQIVGSVGIDTKRGDTIEVSALPFNRSAEQASAKELAAAKAAEASARKDALLRNIGIAGGIVLMLLLAWVQARRRAKAREQATSYLVEQLRADAATRAPALESPAMAALEVAEADEEDTLRDELIALVEKQPEDVAALLRGWLVEPR